MPIGNAELAGSSVLPIACEWEQYDLNKTGKQSKNASR